jgi:hypothetical protein
LTPGIPEQKPQHVVGLGAEQALEITPYRGRLSRCNPLNEHPIEHQACIALLIQEGDLVFLANGLAGRGEEGSDQQGYGVRAISANRVGEISEGQAPMTGLAIGQHSTGQGLPSVRQLKPNEGIDAVVYKSLGQNRRHTANHGDLGQQLQQGQQD